MKCPICKTEARIIKSENVLKSGNLLRRMTYVCRNKTCENFEKEIAREDVKLDVKVEED